ncbi:hypothetical protein ABT186_02065 [Streptomyces sp. NPDC001634]|uniref:hypothetical protein n=1 Tax=Streptomyces sp. NPDC001634 TaxID=3154390 RepID=UPI0033238FC0
MASLLGDSFTLRCPACAAPIILPLTQTGLDLHHVTVVMDLAALRQHIATAHPHSLEHPMSVITDRFHDLVTQLEDEGHHLADEARAVFSHYEKEAAAVLDGVKPILADLRAGVTADVKAVVDEAKAEGADIVARFEAAVVKAEALLQQQPPAAS